MVDRHERAALLVCLLLAAVLSLIIVPRGDRAGFAAHPVFGDFSAPEPGFTFEGLVVRLVDDAVYYQGWYSVDSGEWVPFELSGDAYQGSDAWLLGDASASLPGFGSGVHYVIAYSCSAAVNGEWDCHGGQWQLVVVDTRTGLERGLVVGFDFSSASGGSLEDGAAIVQDAVKGSVLAPSGGVFRVPDAAELDITSTLSLSAWVKPDAIIDNSKIVVKPVAGGVDPWEAYTLDIHGGEVRFVLSDGTSYDGGGWHAVVSPMGAGAWHHVVGTYDGEVMRL
ncbi:hypothetical protein JXA12_02980, partial [Candidatus Woesearchaeota archaeon]|nr:hypothetical protein [Candidatus Woesearchaeota archaeon]